MKTVGLIPFEEMPEDNADLAKLNVQFPRLNPDAPETCPVAMKDLLEYLNIEGSDGEKVIRAKDLKFLRTALVGEARYWIWRLKDGFGDDSYATVCERDNIGLISGYDANYFELTPEQYLLADYHNTL